jgi:hypothetical protein
LFKVSRNDFEIVASNSWDNVIRNDGFKAAVSATRAERALQGFPAKAASRVVLME